MGAVIGAILPHAVGIAISPVPIIAAILMLLSRRAKATSVGFLVGWLVGVFVATLVFAVLAAAVSTTAPSGARPILGVVQLLLGLLLLLLAVRQWRKRPRPGVEPELPAWLKAVDRLTFGTSLGLGILLSAVNPKNLVLAASAGAIIGVTNLNVGETVGTIGIFTLISSLTIAIPVIGYLFAAKRMERPLRALHAWLVRENAVIMSILFLVLGAVIVGKGIASLL
ncbi:GAP family protein [Microbacterium sp. X-17]|uniref:GAP family protein n=1 Tax=Microbacterium sp. X-17 TaxID=3144404 RepID=UPI0031F53554